jgi:hypothetical protein
VLAGTVTTAGLTVLGVVAVHQATRPDPGGIAVAVLPAHTVTITAPVSAVNVSSYGAPIKVTAVAGHGPVQVTEQITFVAGQAPPAVTTRDTRGLLTLGAPACGKLACSVAFTVLVPSGVSVTAFGDGGDVTVDGTGAAGIDSGGGQVYAADVNGPLTVTTEGGAVNVDKVTGRADLNSGGGPVTADNISGPLSAEGDGGDVTVADAPTATLDSGGGQVYATGIGGPLKVTAEGGGVTVSGAGATTVDSGGGPVTATTINGPLGVTTEGGGIQVQGVTGPLGADSGGGPLSAAGLSSATATVTAEGGDVALGFTRAPQSVQVNTGGGGATLSLPGGPYAVSTDAGGNDPGPVISVPVSPAAPRVVSVSTDGGSLQIGQA